MRIIYLYNGCWMGKSCVHKDYAMKLVGMTMTIYDYAMKLLRISLYQSIGQFTFTCGTACTKGIRCIYTEFMDVSWVITGTYYMVKCFDCLYVVIPEVHWYMMVYVLSSPRNTLTLFLGSQNDGFCGCTVFVLAEVNFTDSVVNGDLNLFP